MPQKRIFNVANMYFNTIPENKIYVKISEFTVLLKPVLRRVSGIALS